MPTNLWFPWPGYEGKVNSGLNLLQVLVKDVDTQSIANTLQVGDIASKFSNSLCLFFERLVLEEAGQVRIIVSATQFMKFQQ